MNTQVKAVSASPKGDIDLYGSSQAAAEVSPQPLVFSTTPTIYISLSKQLRAPEENNLPF